MQGTTRPHGSGSRAGVVPWLSSCVERLGILFRQAQDTAFRQAQDRIEGDNY